MIINNPTNAINLVQINNEKGERPMSYRGLHYHALFLNKALQKRPEHGSLEQECQTNSGNYTHVNRHADTDSGIVIQSKLFSSWQATAALEQTGKY